MSQNKKHTYLEVFCEARLNRTENREILERILKKFLVGEVFDDIRFDGHYLVIRNTSENALQLFGDWVREARLLDTIRSKFYSSISNNITAIYFNRQAAFMNHLALVDLDDNPPLGAIALQIVSDNLEEILNNVTPRTYKGKIITESQWEAIKIKEQKKKEQIKIRQDKRKRRDANFIQDK